MPYSISLTLRLACTVALDVLAVLLALVQYYVEHDAGGALACFAGLAFAAWMIAPPRAEVQALLAEARKYTQE